MKAVICEKYGSPEVLQLIEIQRPTPQENEILVKIYATTVTSGEVHLRNGMKSLPFLLRLFGRLAFGFKKPRKSILGAELAGEIESVGKEVRLFKKGDQVFGTTTSLKVGSYAEFICLPEEWETGIVAIKPTNLTYKEAAALPIGANTALHFLKKADISKGNKVLIYGASGSLGTYAVQLAKYFGAEVTGLCSTKNIDLVKSLGADKVIDYTKENFSMNHNYYDVVFDTVGKSSFSAIRRALKKKGIYLAAVMKMSHFFRSSWLSIKIIGGEAKLTNENITFIKKLVETGKLKPIIDKCYPLEKIAEAHSYVEKGHKKGNVVIKVYGDDV